MNKQSRTNPVGKGTKNVPINMPIELAEKLAALARRCGLSVSAYCAGVLKDAAENGWTVKVITTVDRSGSTPVSSAGRTNAPASTHAPSRTRSKGEQDKVTNHPN